MQERNNIKLSPHLQKSKKAYTLIELMIVVTIITMITIMTYVPYNFYSNKEKVRYRAKEISQTLGEARNMTINGLSNSNSNVKIGVYFDKNAGNKIRYLSYPHAFSGIYQIEESNGDNIKIIKEKTLPEMININSINGKENILFIFDSISGDLSLKTEESGIFRSFSISEIVDINFGFKGASTGPLSKIVKYNTKTFITDY